MEGATLPKSNSLQPETVSSQIKQIDRLIRHHLPNASIGIILTEAKTGKTLYERRSKELFPPASVAKLFVASASLLSLGPHYRFTTSVEIREGVLHQGKLTDNLYLRFSGDPSLTTQNLSSLIAQLKNAGIEQIAGDIIIDSTAFQSPHYAMGWSFDSLAWYFAAPVTTIILNENQIPLRFVANVLGDKVAISCESEECKLISLDSDAKVVSKEEAETNCQIEVNMDQENAVSIKGCWPAQPKPTDLKIALKNPNLFAGKFILQTLKAENIQLNGKILFQKIPENLKVIASHRSPPLTELLKKVLQDSNNIYADSLAKTLGLKHLQQGTFKLGTKAIQEILERSTSIDFKALRLFDGSGLSRYNLIAPQQISQLLFTLYHDTQNNKIFQELLPVSGGENGTLATRLNSPDLRGRIRAKTGTLSNTYNLAGYLTSKSNKDLIFVIMTDHVIEEREKINQFESELCSLFARF